MQEDHNKPPETIKEVGIHIGYMSRSIVELKDLLKEQNKSYATKTELLDFEQRNDDRMSRLNTQINDLENWNIWAQRLVLGAVILAILSLILKSSNVF